MICLPPGSAKSTYASKLAPAWFLAQAPYTQIIGASHTIKLAEDMSRAVHNFIRGNEQILGYSLTTENASLWTTSTGCRYLAAGVGSAIAGYRASLAILDDPVASREKADSTVERDKAWNWYLADLRTRLKPDAKIIVIMTRWHEDDLGGRLLETDGGRWRVLKVPAVAIENDPLGRKRGDWLWDGEDAYEYGRELRNVYEEYVRSGALRDWYALYQQEPRPMDGSIFKVGQLKVIPAAKAGGKRVRAWDLAATEKTGTRNPDWTTGVRLAKHDDGSFVVEDVVRLQGGPDDVEAAILQTARLDGRSVEIGLPQDPGQAGKTQVLYLTRKLAGFAVKASPESGDKATRAAPAASQVNVGNVSLVEDKGWNAHFIEELRAFPSGAKDDQVDGFSRAFSMLIAPPDPARRQWFKLRKL